MNIETLSRELVRKIMESDKVIIVPHDRIDFDAIGSAIGLSFIVKELGREAFIVVNDPIQLMPPGIKSIIEESRKNYHIINKEKFKAIVGPNDLYILTDFNRKMLTCIPEYLDNSENIVIIDHHNIYDDTIDSKYQYINNDYSSASEIVVSLLKEYYALNLISNNLANYLFAGISLDTGLYSGHLKNNVSADTFYSLADLRLIGASDNAVRPWFRENLENYIKVYDLVRKSQHYKLDMVFMFDFDPDSDYTRELIARAAVNGLSTSDASFACGMTEDEISLSGRSDGVVDIGYIMRELGGGGDKEAGRAAFKNTSIEEVHERLERVLKPPYIRDIKNK